MILSIAAVLFTFGLVIFLHEFGHFIVCKLVGIRVNAFSFGFGKELLGFTRGDTRYSVRLIPLGGYVKPAGEDLEEVSAEQEKLLENSKPSALLENNSQSGAEKTGGVPVKTENVGLAPYMYFAKPWYTRLGVVLAGPSMNYLLAFVLFAGLIYTVGRPVYSSVIGDVAAGLPAEGAGLKPGDRVLSVDGVKVSAWEDMAALIHKKVDGEVLIGYERKGSAAVMKIKTKRGLDQETGKDVGLIGVSPDQAASVFQKVGAMDSLRFGARQCWFWTAYTVKTLASNIRRREKPDISGPIGIVNIVSKAAHTGMPDLFFLIALISVAVGFFNLLPIPLLDGGHAVIFISEGIFRRKITPRVMGWLNSMGIAFVACIFIFATYSDIKRLIAPKAAPARVEQPAQKK